MNSSLRRHVTAATIVGLLVVSLASAAPPFRAGEVVVAGAPDSLGANVEVVKYLPHADLTVLSVESGREWGQVQRLRARGKRAGLNFTISAAATVNDPYFSPYQWHFSNIQAEMAWDLTNGAGAVVAVLDSGLAPGGADGIACVVPGRDVVNGDDDPFDGDGHGTHVSGTIAQRSNDGVGCAGLAHGACVMPVKVLDDGGSGSFADLAEGIYWAVDNGAQVINMSLATDAAFKVRNDVFVDPALDYAYSHGVTVVCAAGNDGNRKNVSYPAIYPSTIAVGATDYADAVTGYSNKGSGLDLVAPGGDMSADLNGDGYGDGVLQETYVGGWSYYFFEGTSMAAPHVSAVAAMLYATGAATSPNDVRAVLTTSAKDVGRKGFDTATANGLVQAFDALSFGVGTPPCTDDDSDGWCVDDGDCDDDDPAINPGAAEICDDGLDNNCDGVVDEGCGGVCPDADFDSFLDAFCGGGDCDDSNATVFPNAPEICGDGLDNDCNGLMDDGCACSPRGAACVTNADCCSGSCHAVKGTCK